MMSFHRPFAFLVIPALVWLVLVGDPGQLPAQSPYDTLNVEIQPFANVYRVIVKTPDLKPAKQDVSLQVLARINNYRMVESIISKELIISAGKNSGIVEVSLGNRGNSGWYQSEIILEDNDNGVFDSRDFLRENYSTSNNWANVDRMLFVSSNIASVASRNFTANRRRAINRGFSALGVTDPGKLPSFVELLKFYEAYNMINKGTITSNLSFLQNTNSYFHCIHPSDFFRQWTSLSCFNGILISKSDLQLLVQSSETLNSLKNWISIGGQLVVFDTQKGFADRDQILRLISGPTSIDLNWQQPSKALKNLNGYIMPESWQVSQSSDLVDFSDLTFERFIEVDLDADPGIIKTEFQIGRVFLIDNDLTDWSSGKWQTLFNSMDRNSIASTLGTSSADRRFKHDFRIPGIGDPPIGAFQFLITAFVVIIGPGFYFVFSRRGRLYLLLLAVPAVSLFAVASLFLYAVINDGFDIRGRSQSLTEIDHRLERGITHSRSVYYSGVSPNDSVFDKDELVHAARSDYTPVTRYRIREDRQSVSGGLMRARSPFQLTNLKCLDTDKRLTFTPSGDGTRGTISNGFDSDFEVVVVRTPKGWFWAESVAGESAAQASAIQLKDLNPKIRQLAVQLNPDDEQQGSTSLFKNSGLAIIANPYSTSISKWGRVDDVMTRLRESGVDDQLIPENSYLAISQDGEFTSNPQPQAIFEGTQLHVIIGKW